jgi:hypothetical protein
MDTLKQLEHRIESDEIYCDSNFAYLMFDLDSGSTPTGAEAIDGAWFELPYWIESVEAGSDKAIYSHGSQGEYLDNGDYARTLGEKVKSLTGKDYVENDEFLCEYNTGYYEPLNYGDIVRYNGKDYVYVDSVSLPEEMEHQADNGELCYEYRGSSYLRIFTPINQ